MGGPIFKARNFTHLLSVKTQARQRRYIDQSQASQAAEWYVFLRKSMGFSKISMTTGAMELTAYR